MYHQMKDDEKKNMFYNGLMNKIFIMNHGGGYLICCTSIFFMKRKIQLFYCLGNIISASDAAVY